MYTLTDETCVPPSFLYLLKTDVHVIAWDHCPQTVGRMHFPLEGVVDQRHVFAVFQDFDLDPIFFDFYTDLFSLQKINGPSMTLSDII